MRSAIAGLGLLVALGCGPPAPAEAPGVWWARIGAGAGVAANFGPLLATPDGVVRPFTLVVHLPGSDEPLSCVAESVLAAASDPVVVEGARYSLALAPRPGLTWAEVRTDEDLVSESSGLF
ncbi:MAG: hypothetical protein AAF682_31405 [Planctomycetota bacterium]